MDNERLATVEAQCRWITQDVHEIKSDVKQLLAFKWKATGVMALILFAVEFARAMGK